MQSRGKGEFLSENFGVFRLRRNVFNPRSYVGAMVTSRVDGAGNRNFAYGVDGIINVFKQDYLKINIAQTMDTGDTSNTPGIDRARIYLHAYHDAYPVTRTEIAQAITVRYLQSMVSLWIETEHYLEDNDRTDVFLEAEYASIRYSMTHHEEYIERLCDGIVT